MEFRPNDDHRGKMRWLLLITSQLSVFLERAQLLLRLDPNLTQPHRDAD